MRERIAAEPAAAGEGAPRAWLQWLARNWISASLSCEAKVLQDPVIADIAQAHGTTPAQVALAWALQQGYAVIPSSTKRANLESNLKARQLTLSDADMARIATLDRGERLANPGGIAPAWD